MAQPVDVEAVEEAAGLGTLPFRVSTKVVSELGAEVAAREPGYGVLSAHKGDEELVAIVGRHPDVG
jgi:hypothetical protein